MTDLITRAKAALEGTTEGPWMATTHHIQGHDRLVEIDYVENEDGTGVHISPRYAVEAEVGPNARFIAAARTLIPELIAALEAKL